MGVVPVGAGVLETQAILETLSRLDRVLRDIGHTIHSVIYSKPMPMHACGLAQLIVDIDDQNGPSLPLMDRPGI